MLDREEQEYDVCEISIKNENRLSQMGDVLSGEIT